MHRVSQANLLQHIPTGHKIKKMNRNLKGKKSQIRFGGRSDARKRLSLVTVVCFVPPHLVDASMGICKSCHNWRKKKGVWTGTKMQHGPQRLRPFFILFG
ncbi:hypothetical protein QN277_011985 [Acacia crassicarpa]|uniref:Uncharacterized protein n=1 Tax=Acacia crassicarpa TaxID=499986 RepID=A0AAE1N0J9_9FABA|nr:hypothetical protein QN277_011985 [Acacia crassicarpa]